MSGLLTYAVASYNHSGFIKRTLDSLVADGYSHREILILDDGSTDSTDQVVRQWISENPKESVTYKKRENRGLTRTLNQLIAMSKGRYLRLCSSDDTLIAGSSYAMISEMEKDPGARAIFGDGIVVDNHDYPIKDSMLEFFGSSASQYSKDLGKAIIMNWAVAGPSLIVRDDAFEKENPYPTDLRVEDWYMYVRLLSKDYLRFFPGKVTNYRVHDTNTSRVSDPPKRIANLTSQVRAADLNLPLFSGRLKRMMKSERALLEAKISYLKGRTIPTAIQLVRHFYYRITASV